MAYIDTLELVKAIEENKRNTEHHKDSYAKQIHVNEHRHFLKMVYEQPTADVVSRAEIMEIFEELDRLKKGSEWISVKERLPDTSDQILIYLDNGNICVGYYDIADKHFIIFLSATTRAIYWMPLPEPPNVKGGVKQ